MITNELGRSERLARPARRLVGVLAATCLLGACTTAPTAPVGASPGRAHLPLQSAWYDGEVVFYVTTDASDADVAREKGANFVPALANVLPTEATRMAGHRSAVDAVYAVTNAKQKTVFASAPAPIGAFNRDTAYSPLWQLVRVTWRRPGSARELRSQEDVLAAAESKEVDLETTRIVINCPVVHRGTAGGLPGVAIDVAAR